MSRLIALIIVFALPTVAFGQVSLGTYRQAKSELSRSQPGDSQHEQALQILRGVKQDFKDLFEGLPDMYVVTFRANKANEEDWLTKAKLELRRSGIRMADSASTQTVVLSLSVYKHRSSGLWESRLILKEDVRLKRRTASREIFCVTYLDEGASRRTQAEAEEDAWKALNQFCLLYMEFGK